MMLYMPEMDMITMGTDSESSSLEVVDMGVSEGAEVAEIEAVVPEVHQHAGPSSEYLSPVRIC